MITTTLLPPAPRGPGGPPPLLPLALTIGLLAALFPGIVAVPARAADLIGYRIAVVACLKAACRDLPLQRSFEEGRYACQTIAADLATVAEVRGPKALDLPPGPWTFRGMCLPIFGQRRA